MRLSHIPVYIIIESDPKDYEIISIKETIPRISKYPRQLSVILKKKRILIGKDAIKSFIDQSHEDLLSKVENVLAWKIDMNRIDSGNIIKVAYEELYFKKELFGGFDFIFNPDLKPEEMVSVEIGFRKQYEKRFTLDVSAYINEYDNLIQYVNVGGGIYGPFQVQNIAKAQISGLEFLIDYTGSLNMFKKTLGYSFGFNYSLIDAKDLSKNRKDEFLPYKPRHLINFNTDLSYYDFNFNVTGKYVSEVEEDLFYKYEEPKAYFLLDMKISKKLFGQATIFFAVNNILNESYQELERTQAPNRNFNSGIRVEF